MFISNRINDFAWPVSHCLSKPITYSAITALSYFKELAQRRILQKYFLNCTPKAEFSFSRLVKILPKTNHGKKNVCKCIVCRQENNFVQLRNKEKFNLNLLKLMFQSSKFFLGINCNIVEWLWVDIWSSFPMDSAASWKGWASVEAFVFNELGKTKQLSNSSSISTTFIK